MAGLNAAAACTGPQLNERGADMIGAIAAAAAGVIAVPTAGGLAYRKSRQRRVAQALVIDTPNGIVEERFVRVGGIEQWIQIRGEDRDNPVLLVLHGGPDFDHRLRDILRRLFQTPGW